MQQAAHPVDETTKTACLSGASAESENEELVIRQRVTDNERVRGLDILLESGAPGSAQHRIEFRERGIAQPTLRR
jgi:hypothetical protein